jgi:prolyl 4-hydroxylase
MLQSRYVIVLLTFVTIGMAVGALLQLAFLKQLEESSRSEIDIFHQMDQDSSLNKTTGIPSVYSIWKNDEDARILRIGMVKQEMLNWQPRIILFHNFLSADVLCFIQSSCASYGCRVSSIVAVNSLAQLGELLKFEKIFVTP